MGPAEHDRTILQADCLKGAIVSHPYGISPGLFEDNLPKAANTHK
jgi:hypothetical protein